jgi:hypothetical protein
MQEVLPLTLGVLIGVAAMTLSRAGWRLAAIPLACILGGVAASAINGELAHRGWLVFVSVDALLVWIGATIGYAILAGVRRPRPS